MLLLEKFRSCEVYYTEFAVSFIVSLGTLITGLNFGWIGPALLILQDEKLSPIHYAVSTYESSWINSVTQLGALSSTFLGAYFADRFGRKVTIQLSVIPNVISFLLIAFVKNIEMLYVARFIVGISMGITLGVVPIYIAEISSPKIRGIFGTFTGLLISIGLILQYATMPYMTLKSNSIIALVFTGIQGLGTLLIPETPYYYIMKDKDYLAEQSLKKLRRKCNISEELSELKVSWNIEKKNKISLCGNMKLKVNRKGLLIVTIIIIGQQMCGSLTVVGNIPTILKNSTLPIPSNWISLVLIFLYSLAVFISSFFIDNWGRKPLFIFSTISIAITLTLIGVYFQLQTMYGLEVMLDYSIVLIILLAIYMVFFGFGIFGMMFLCSAELFDTNFRATAVSILSVVSSFMGFLNIEMYELIGENYGIEYAFWTFAIICFIVAILSLLFLVETKGKTFHQIQKELKGL